MSKPSNQFKLSTPQSCVQVNALSSKRTNKSISSTQSFPVPLQVKNTVQKKIVKLQSELLNEHPDVPIIGRGAKKTRNLSQSKQVPVVTNKISSRFN